MMVHINKNNLLNIEQFGFQNKKSSTDAVLFFTETLIENHENGQNTAAIFLDLAKAFNSISHKIFLKKAECFDFSEPAVNLLRPFLEGRSQCVKLGTEVSEHIFVNHRVPQVTVLGPPIFLLYVNDYSEKIKGDFELVQFADETSILCRYEPGETVATKIEIIVLKTDSYLKENQLTLNADKTELLYFSTRDELEPKVTFNRNLIKSAESCRYLAIHLDSKLTFEAHLNVVFFKKNGGSHSLTISIKYPYTFGSKVASFQIFSPVSFVIQGYLSTNIVSKKYTAYKSTD